ncbi:MAG: ATP synthase subunit C [Candidatus Methylarchaceae archaeon HK02M1]|nr:ATP synthase subunit C [Candidatus Methylarchaceae archaeon HK01M]MCP8311676.1 ATP synthase subunit C [Candidatus Methylarchaceae archaeon HK02M1]
MMKLNKKIIEFFSNPRRAMLSFIFLNVATLIIALFLFPPIARAQEVTPESGLKFIAAALAVSGSGIGAGLAVYGAASAGAAAIAERPGVATWILILAGLGEGIAIYGLIISILVLGA